MAKSLILNRNNYDFLGFFSVFLCFLMFSPSQEKTDKTQILIFGPGFETFGAGSRPEISRRIRISGKKRHAEANNWEKRIQNIYFLTCFAGLSSQYT